MERGAAPTTFTTACPCAHIDQMDRLQPIWKPLAMAALHFFSARCFGLAFRVNDTGRRRRTSTRSDNSCNFSVHKPHSFDFEKSRSSLPQVSRDDEADERKTTIIDVPTDDFCWAVNLGKFSGWEGGQTFECLAGCTKKVTSLLSTWKAINIGEGSLPAPASEIKQAVSRRRPLTDSR